MRAQCDHSGGWGQGGTGFSSRPSFACWLNRNLEKQTCLLQIQIILENINAKTTNITLLGAVQPITVRWSAHLEP